MKMWAFQTAVSHNIWDANSEISNIFRVQGALIELRFKNTNAPTESWTHGFFVP